MTIFAPCQQELINSYAKLTSKQIDRKFSKQTILWDMKLIGVPQDNRSSNFNKSNVISFLKEYCEEHSQTEREIIQAEFDEIMDQITKKEDEIFMARKIINQMAEEASILSIKLIAMGDK